MKSSRIRLACVVFFALTIPRTIAAQMRVEAVAGEPFGIAHVTLPASSDLDQSVVQTNGFAIDDPADRIFYPAFGTSRVMGVIRELIGAPARGSSSVSVFFLFKGDSPFEATVRIPAPFRVRVVPEFRPRRHQRMLQRWWNQYNTIARNQVRRSDYPPIVETYLTTMLGQRLRLPIESLDTKGKKRTFSNDLIGLTLNLESQRIQALRRTMLPSSVVANATRYRLPADPIWPNRSVQGVPPKKIAIEPIATRVPNNCFYIRFGTFTNYLWLKGLLEENGGDIGRMITLRGHDTMLSQKSQQQLGLKESMLANMLGPRVIDDVALIGSDIYLREGAALGVLFKAKNGLLKNDLMKQRQNAVKAFATSESKIESIRVDGRDVSFASTPTNALRSFYVIDGDYHLVTNSRALVQRFLKTKNGIGSLAESPEFQTVRAELPVSRKDVVFAHLSTEFFRNLLGNQYQIELRRRLSSIAEIELLMLARRAAQAEGLPDTKLASLVRAGFLPSGFGKRADDSFLMEDEQNVFDTVRGLRGHFLPIPDVEVKSVSSSELQSLNQIATVRQNHWRDADPLTLAIQRFATEDKSRERILISARLLPFNRESFGRFGEMVGPPVETEISQPPEDIMRAQMSMRGGQLMASSPYTMFFGMRDADVPLDFGRSSFMRTLQVLQTAPAYLGAWPKPGFLDRLPIARHLPVDPEGMTRLPFGLWRWQSVDGSFSALSFQRAILALSAPDFAVRTAESSAQFRVFVGDTSNARIRPWFNVLNYWRAFETSIGNTRLLHTLNQQLGIELADTRTFAENVLAIKMLCPLDGEYKLVEQGGHQYWISSQWPNHGDLDVRTYQSPFAKWFRGMDARATVFDDRVIADALVDVQRDAAPAAALPLFDMLKNNPFQNIRKGSSTKQKTKADTDSPVKNSAADEKKSRVDAPTRRQVEELPAPVGKPSES